MADLLNNEHEEIKSKILAQVICLESDYKGDFSRGIISGAELLATIPDEEMPDFLTNFGETEINDWNAWTYRPLVHINFFVPESLERMDAFLSEKHDSDRDIPIYLNETPITNDALTLIKSNYVGSDIAKVSQFSNLLAKIELSDFLMMDSTVLAPDVHDDAELGRFLYDNDFLLDAEVSEVQNALYDATTNAEKNLPLVDSNIFERIGKRHREAEGGTFTEDGYMEDLNKDDGGINHLENKSTELQKGGTIDVFITNLGKYNEGQLVGEWHSFPTTPEAIQDVLKRIGIDGVRYEEIFLTDYESPISGVHEVLSEHANLDEINYLASKLEDLDKWELEVFEAAVDLGDYSSDVASLINLTENIESFDYLQGVNDDYDLGVYWVDEAGVYDTKAMGNLGNYIDYERFGRDIRLEEGGVFASGGYVATRDEVSEVYSGIDDIPDEYRVFTRLDESEHEDSITVLLVEPEKQPREITIDNTLEAKQQLVGGMIQAIYPYDEYVGLVCNDEGKMDGLPLNRALYDEDGTMYDIVAGNFFIAGLGDEGDFTSLSPELIKKFTEQFRAPEQFVKLAGQIKAVKMPVEKPKDEQAADKPKPKGPEL